MNSPFRVVCLIAAVAISAAVWWASLQFYTDAIPETRLWIVFAAFVTASAIVKLGFPYASKHFDERPVRVLLWTCVIACALFDIFGVSGFFNMTRGASLESKAGESQDYKKLEAKVGVLKIAAAKYAETRATSIINAELKVAKDAAPKQCNRSNSHLDSCKAVAALEIELAEAGERDKAAKDLKTADENLTAANRPNTARANPLAVTFQKLAFGKISLETAGFFADIILSILTVVIAECVPTALSFVALNGGRKPFVPHDVASAANEPPDPPPRAARRSRSPPADLMAALRAIRDGTLTQDGLAVSGNGIVVSNRALGLAIGASASKVNAGLKDLANTGKVTLRPGSGGTYVELI